MWLTLISDVVTILCANLTVGFFIATKIGFEQLPVFLIVTICSLITTCYLKWKNTENCNWFIILFAYSMISWMLFIADNSLVTTPFHPEYLFLGLLSLAGIYLTKENSFIGIYSLIFVLLSGLLIGIYQIYKLLNNSLPNNSEWGYLSAIIIILTNIVMMYKVFFIQYKINPVEEKTSLRYLNLWFSFFSVLLVLSISMIVASNALTPNFCSMFLAFFISLLIWRFMKVVKKIPNINSDILLIVGLLAINWQEKAFFQFGARVGILLNTLDYTAIENSVILITAMFGCIKTYQQSRLASLFPLTICLYVILNQPFNYIYPIIENSQYHLGYHYFPGMWTALLSVPVAVRCFVKLMPIFNQSTRD